MKKRPYKHLEHMPRPDQKQRLSEALIIVKLFTRRNYGECRRYLFGVLLSASRRYAAPGPVATYTLPYSA